MFAAGVGYLPSGLRLWEAAFRKFEALPQHVEPQLPRGGRNGGLAVYANLWHAILVVNDHGLQFAFSRRHECTCRSHATIQSPVVGGLPAHRPPPGARGGTIGWQVCDTGAAGTFAQLVVRRPGTHGVITWKHELLVVAFSGEWAARAPRRVGASILTAKFGNGMPRRRFAASGGALRNTSSPLSAGAATVWHNVNGN